MRQSQAIGHTPTNITNHLPIQQAAHKEQVSQLQSRLTAAEESVAALTAQVAAAEVRWGGACYPQNHTCLVQHATPTRA
jgi:hypothetical protein